jgi:hypothetical protein
LLPVLNLRGVSTGDFQEALAALLGKDAPNLSPAVIARLTAAWQADYDAWCKRDLSARRYAYVWADGVYLQARMEDAAECMLLLIGATPEGKKELVGFQTGVRESAQSWREIHGAPTRAAAEAAIEVRSNNQHGLADRGEPAIEPDEEQAIAVVELDATAHLSLQHDQLLPERSIFRFKSTLGPEERSQQIEDQGNPGDHHRQRAAISSPIQCG